MRRSRMVVAIVALCAIMGSVEASAATLTVTLERTSPLTNVNDAFSLVQLDSGDVLLDGVVVGHYVREKRTAPLLGINNAAVRITLFVNGTGDPYGTLVMQGSHSFNNGLQKGAVSAVPAELAFLQNATFVSAAGGVFAITY